MDELLDFLPGGPWLLGAAALLAIPGVRRTLRPVAKATIKVGIGVVDQVKGLTAEAREQASDLYAEAKAERAEPAENLNGSASSSPVTGRSRRTEPAGAGD